MQKSMSFFVGIHNTVDDIPIVAVLAKPLILIGPSIWIMKVIHVFIVNAGHRITSKVLN